MTAVMACGDLIERMAARCRLSTVLVSAPDAENGTGDLIKSAEDVVFGRRPINRLIGRAVRE